MTLQEIYKTEEYKYLADQIENHERAVHLLMKELTEKFKNTEAAKNRAWCVMGDFRPHLKTYIVDENYHS